MEVFSKYLKICKLLFAENPPKVVTNGSSQNSSSGYPGETMVCPSRGLKGGKMCQNEKDGGLFSKYLKICSSLFAQNPQKVATTGSSWNSTSGCPGKNSGLPHKGVKICI